MPQAVFHIVFAIITAEIIREFFVKKKFPLYYVFIAGIAGVLPDIDVVAFWILYFFGFTLESVHRTFTHTLFLPLFFIVLSLLAINLKNKKIWKRKINLSLLFFMIALGIFTHLLLDVVIAGEIMPLYPFYNISYGLNLVELLPYALSQMALPVFDAAIFIIWLFWLEYKHKISDFV